MSEQRELLTLADQIEADQIDMDNIGTHRRELIISSLRAADEIASLREQIEASEERFDDIWKHGLRLEKQLASARKALEEIANRAGNYADPDAGDWMISIYQIANAALSDENSK